MQFQAVNRNILSHRPHAPAQIPVLFGNAPKGRTGSLPMSGIRNVPHLPEAGYMLRQSEQRGCRWRSGTGPLRHQDQHCFCKAATVVQKTGGADQLSAYRKGQRLRGFASKHSRLALCDLKHLSSIFVRAFLHKFCTMLSEISALKYTRDPAFCQVASTGRGAFRSGSYWVNFAYNCTERDCFFHESVI